MNKNLQNLWRASFWILIMMLIFTLTIQAQDPNTDPNWDWRNGDYPEAVYPTSQYKFYIENSVGQIIAVPRNAPWGQGNAWIGLDDNKKEDGWVLVNRDFGSPARPIYANDQKGSPHFILYNKYRGILRFFIIVRTGQDYSSGAIELKFNPDNGHKTATLTHLKPRAYATDKIDAVKNNVGTALTSAMGDNWAWADFQMAYDPTIVPSNDGAWLDFRIIGTEEGELKINGTATGVGGTQKNVRDYMTGSSVGPVDVANSMPSSVGENFNAFKEKISGTQSDWSGWQKFIGDSYNKLPILPEGPLASANNTLKLALGELRDSWIVQSLPLIGAGVGVVDFFVGGGRKTDVQKTGPTFFGFNLELRGTLTIKNQLPNPKRIQVPTSKLNAAVPVFGSLTPLIYNQLLGVINLTKTPILKYKSYSQSYYDGSPIISRLYLDFQVKDNLEFKINPVSGLELDSILAWIVMDPTDNVIIHDPANDQDLRLLAKADQGLFTTLSPIKLESSIDGRYVFRSIPVDGKAFKYQTIQGPVGINTPDMTIKIKAVFHRKDDETALPVVIVSTYEPELENAGTGRWPVPPFPVVTPVANKWNMLGLPNQSYNYIQGSANYNANYVYANAIPPVYAYESGAYVAKDVLNTNAGYWVQFPSAQNITYYGPGLFSKTIAVKAGWNLISSVSAPIATNNISSVPAGIVSSYFYEYNGGYQQTTVVKPGYGHWVKVSQDGQIVLDGSTSTTPLPPPSGTPPPPAPTLFSPSDLAANQSVSPALIWNIASSANSYRLQVSTASDFSAVLVNDGSITGTSKQVGPLSNHTTYFWRVNASNSSGTGLWSSVWKFSTQGGSNSDPCVLADITSAASMDQLTITDANGNRQSLYVRNRGRGVKNGLFDDVDMPPVPMAGIFDVRFQSGKSIESIPPTREQVKIPIAIRGAAYPLTISWNIKSDNATTYILTMPGTQNEIRSERIQLKNNGSRRLNNADDGIISLQASSNPCPGPVVDKMGTTPDDVSNIPSSYTLHQNTPNPFNPSTTIGYDVPVEGYVTLKVYDILGREVATLADGVQSAGFKSLNFDAGKLTSGVYFYRLHAGKFTDIRKMILLR